MLFVVIEETTLFNMGLPISIYSINNIMWYLFNNCFGKLCQKSTIRTSIRQPVKCTIYIFKPTWHPVAVVELSEKELPRKSMGFASDFTIQKSHIAAVGNIYSLHNVGQSHESSVDGIVSMK